MSIIEYVKAIPKGTQIPKPESDEIYTVVGLGKSRGEPALVYQIPGKSKSTKRVPLSAFKWADEQLVTTGKLVHSDFTDAFPKVDNDGGCNFTTLGGVFVLMGDAFYETRSVYRRKEK